jgi:hypothetical protein
VISISPDVDRRIAPARCASVRDYGRCMSKRLSWLLVAACRSTPSARAPVPSPPTDRACADALPLLAKQHTRNVTRTYVADFSFAAGAATLGTWAPVTAKQGFINQPAFTPDGGGIYFTWRPEGSQADIYVRDLRTGAERGVTCTAEEEYSPAVTTDGLVVLRVEPDLSRRIVRLGADGRVRDVLFPGVADIGAFLWIDDTHVALMFAGAGSTRLAIGDPTSGTLEPIAENVTGALAVVPGAHAITYVDAAGERPTLMRFDLDGKSRTPVVPLPEGADKVASLPDGSVIAGRGKQLVRAAPPDAAWHAIADLGAAIEGTITRVIISGGHIAVVTKLD